MPGHIRFGIAIHIGDPGTLNPAAFSQADQEDWKTWTPCVPNYLQQLRPDTPF
jgi:hypothetical protein